jgi:hypothetical protein
MRPGCNLSKMKSDKDEVPSPFRLHPSEIWIGDGVFTDPSGTIIS